MTIDFTQYPRRHVGLSDTGGRTATLDIATWAQNTIDYAHHETHAGSAYFAVYSALGNNAAVTEVRVGTPNTTKWAHMVFIIECGLAATVSLWTPTTKTDASANRLTPLNRDNNSINTSGLTICHTPGGSQAGAANLVEYVGANSNKALVGGGTSSRGEFILKQNSSYLIQIVSRADANSMTIIMDWYEHTNKA